MGGTPSHPELLDHLATRFRAEGWSLKRLHREMMLSSVYRMSSRPDDAEAEKQVRWIALGVIAFGPAGAPPLSFA